MDCVGAYRQTLDESSDASRDCEDACSLAMALDPVVQSTVTLMHADDESLVAMCPVANDEVETRPSTSVVVYAIVVASMVHSLVTLPHLKQMKLVASTWASWMDQAVVGRNPNSSMV